MSEIELRPIRINTLSDDEEGRLIMLDDRLIGVLLRLEAREQAPLQGFWSLEAGFGPMESTRPDPFKGLDEARLWAERVTGSAA